MYYSGICNMCKDASCWFSILHSLSILWVTRGVPCILYIPHPHNAQLCCRIFVFDAYSWVRNLCTMPRRAVTPRSWSFYRYPHTHTGLLRGSDAWRTPGSPIGYIIDINFVYFVLCLYPMLHICPSTWDAKIERKYSRIRNHY